MKCTQCGYFNLPNALACGRCGMDLAHPTARAGGSLQESLYPPRARDRTLREQIQRHVRLPSLPKAAPMPPLGPSLWPWLIMTAALAPGAGHFLLRDTRRGVYFLASFLAILSLVLLLIHWWVSDLLLWGLLGIAGYSVWDVTQRVFPPADQNPESRYYRHVRLGFLSVGTVAGTLASFYWLASQWYPLYQMTNDQSAPALQAGDNVLEHRLTKPLTSLRRGDIVVAQLNEYPVIERILGLPGDHIVYAGGVLLVNGHRVGLEHQPLSAASRIAVGTSDVVVPPGQVYLWVPQAGMFRGEGDVQVPPAAFGTLDAENVEGCLIAIVGPPARRRWFH